ncbi:Uncharacterized protein Fot_11670 [Forsythia ovata]|uniref:Uncharacterized protein n=1 Tax=Forsythia ovata TaxID=205694 RepID=A0ABD1WKB6_9LAMI
MDTPIRRFTRSLTKRESLGNVAKTVGYLRKNVIYLDTPTPTKDSNNDQSIGTRRRMSSCAGKESPGNPFLNERKFSPVIALSSGSKKNKDSHGFEPKCKFGYHSVISSDNHTSQGQLAKGSALYFNGATVNHHENAL